MASLERALGGAGAEIGVIAARPARTSPGVRRAAGQPAEGPREVSLVGEAAGQRDL